MFRIFPQLNYYVLSENAEFLLILYSSKCAFKKKLKAKTMRIKNDFVGIFLEILVFLQFLNAYAQKSDKF
jgi:hypothetical protein